MNILIPHTWLLEHLDTAATPEVIAKYLSLSGPSVERIQTIDDEPVYDIEITTNRIDAASIRGIAREAAAILPQSGIKAVLKPLSLTAIKGTKPLNLVIVNNHSLCHRILAVLLTDIDIEASPAIIQKRLRQVGARPLNNVIDLTNYVMWEIGHPIHAFDFDRLKTKKIIVREAKQGESLITLDNQSKTLKGGEVIFDDGTGTIIDLPGIMGTKNTVVTADTKNVLLWLESIDAVKIRYASMGLDIRSQAAVLNEKQVDPDLGAEAIKRAVGYYQSICHASIGSKLVDIYEHPPQVKTIVLKQERLDSYLGITLNSKKVIDMLTSLGCAVNFNLKSQTYTVLPPNYRAQDLIIYQDLIEEVARLYGYHRLGSSIMPTSIPDNTDFQKLHLETELKKWLVGWGYQEVYTYSMVSAKTAQMSRYSLDKHLKIANPLSQDWVYLRRSLVPSLLSTITDNPQQKVSVFELANTYTPQKPHVLPEERTELALITNSSYDQLKGVVESLFQKLHLEATTFTPSAYTRESFDPDNSAQIIQDKQIIGYIGKIQNQPVVAAVLYLKPIKALAHLHPQKIVLYSNPPLIETLTFTIPTKLPLGEIIQTINNQPYVANVIYDRSKNYLNNRTFVISYRHPDKPLSVRDISPIRQKIVTDLETKFNTKLVGSLT